jgi:hypothetical protein
MTELAAELLAHAFLYWLSVSIHKSSGRNPVRFAVRATIRGPISSLSWNANA